MQKNSKMSYDELLRLGVAELAAMAKEFVDDEKSIAKKQKKLKILKKKQKPKLSKKHAYLYL